MASATLRTWKALEARERQWGGFDRHGMTSVERMIGSDLNVAWSCHHPNQDPPSHLKCGLDKVLLPKEEQAKGKAEVLGKGRVQVRLRAAHERLQDGHDNVLRRGARGGDQHIGGYGCSQEATSVYPTGTRFPPMAAFAGTHEYRVGVACVYPTGTRFPWIAVLAPIPLSCVSHLLAGAGEDQTQGQGRKARDFHADIGVGHKGGEQFLFKGWGAERGQGSAPWSDKRSSITY